MSNVELKRKLVKLFTWKIFHKKHRLSLIHFLLSISSIFNKNWTQIIFSSFRNFTKVPSFLLSLRFAAYWFSLWIYFCTVTMENWHPRATSKSLTLCMITIGLDSRWTFKNISSSRLPTLKYHSTTMDMAFSNWTWNPLSM